MTELMNKKEIKMSTGSVITVYDNVFTLHEMTKMEEFCKNSLYRFIPLHKKIDENVHFLGAIFNADDISNFSFYNNSNVKQIVESLGEYNKMDRAWALTSTYMSNYYYHTDADDGKTILYYVNTKWDNEWGGETILCDKSGDAEIAISYKPNRIVVFDSNIFHKPSMTTTKSNPFRFSFTTTFIK
jgi:hypothetical protein